MNGKPELQEIERLKTLLHRLEQERDEALESADILQAVFESSYDAIIIHTLDGKILDVNQAFRKLHGVSREEARRLTIADFSAPSMSMETAAEIWWRVLAGDDQHFEWKGRRYRDGAEFDAEVFLRRVRREGQNVVLAHVRDITRYKQAAADVAERQRAEEEVFQTRDRLENMIRNAPISLAMFDRSMRYVRASDRWLKDVGLPEQDLVGKSHYDVFPQLPQHWKEAHRRGLAGETVEGEEDWIAKDGTKHTVRWKVHPWGDSGSETGGIIIFLEDITDRKMAEEQLRASEVKFRAVFEQAAIGMGRVSFTDARWIDVNQAFCRMLGYSPAEMRATPWPQITHPADVDLDLVPFRRMAAGELDSYTVEKRFIHKRGNHVWARLTLSLVRDAQGQPDYEIAVIENITERKEAEEQLRRAMTAAEEASRAKSEFLATMSHELRTPMTVILGSLEFLKNAPNAPERSQLLEMADSSANRLLGIIDDLLDISKIEARQLGIEEQPFDLRSCVRQAVEIFAPQAREKGIRLHWTVDRRLPEQVSGDPARISQVLINLVGNAVKFTKRGEVAVSVAEGKKGELKFTIRDTGIGISAEKMDRLFKPFSQVDSSLTRPYGGTGLGLAISRELVEMMGGSIEVESESGKGSTFTFTIPVRAAERPEEVPPKPIEKEVQPLQILLAEDDPMVRDLVKMILDRRGLSVAVAENGRDAVARWQEGGIDLILMDLQMPEMNGLEATRRIRELEAPGRRTCIFALTAHVRAEDRQECLAAGMDGFLAKPLQMEELSNLIESCPCGRGAGMRSP